MKTIRQQFIEFASRKHNPALRVGQEIWRWSASGKMPAEFDAYYAGLRSELAEIRLHNAITRRHGR